MMRHLDRRVFYRSTYVNPNEKQRMMLRGGKKKISMLKIFEGHYFWMPPWKSVIFCYC